ncbi:hypothetical protein BAUCODRAFT_311096 [Baudoinia panamericana UAMH 10762]|uniref:ATPase synthesis protein 25 n=1 Tax=Baudoinia panamericana (strain UAMH 10762) TaxID=717646 RepID=M2LD83_BAUPA|nr:uncharacterized protein BAUCODRAFT_311096 [Baudoinia panamericana UAMH 10762]EMC91917.1 hypothetical protein BAUCODRAFT_311096 [Baudoinia panamericana UAMH 10762]
MAMAVPIARTTAKTLACAECRRWALRSFIGSIGASTAPRPPQVQRRAFSRTVTRSNEARERVQHDEHALNEINDIGSEKMITQARPQASRPAQRGMNDLESTGAGDELQSGHSTRRDEEMSDGAQGRLSYSQSALPDETDEAHELARESDLQEEDAPPPPSNTPPELPWYLRVQQETQALQPSESPMAARQRIPDLPSHPPAILQPLMEHVSVNLGLDDLSLLDLRTLHNPPPALGANLLMLLGTARSEKHLHVSADRLCRWLRSEYKLTPSADGLLGRNELKLKLRRRMKRARLMSAAGGSAEVDADMEGIRTGWVCVDVGRVEGGELPEQEKRREERERGVVGFGVGVRGCSVVVQMLTEEKRGEVDLEKLWMGILRRAERERLEAEKEAEERRVEGGQGRERSVLMQELDAPGMASSVGSVQRDAGMAAG